MRDCGVRGGRWISGMIRKRSEGMFKEGVVRRAWKRPRLTNSPPVSAAGEEFDRNNGVPAKDSTAEIPQS